MHTTREAGKILSNTIEFAAGRQHEYVTPEHFLYVLTGQDLFVRAFVACGGDIERLQKDLDTYFLDNIEKKEDLKPQVTQGLELILTDAYRQAVSSGKQAIELQHLIHCLLELQESYAVFFIASQGIDLTDLLCEICQYGEEFPGRNKEPESSAGNPKQGGTTEDHVGKEYQSPEQEKPTAGVWKQYVEPLNDLVEHVNPLIGRETELERTIQILCRKEKNNPLHIGESGVGKTAITYGLARLLKENKVPNVLKGAKIYAVDLGGMLSGTQFRGDFEKRFKNVMEGISREEKPIVYFDEIHNIVGAGAVNGGSFDISNMLKPYLSEGSIRFIGATTYEEYKKYFAKNKSLVRRFQNVDINEPNEEETVKILAGLKKHYEKFHGVKYGKGVLAYAVAQSAKYINERYLPDKAIDLMDEAGAYRQLHPLDQKTQTVGKGLIDDIVSKICSIPKQTVENDEVKKLAGLDSRLLNHVFGQEEAVSQVVNAIRFSRAGLLEEGKPLASLLFVGPTGVGKTEIARSLAKEMGMKLLRFDMSEYSEKHALVKLIGSPAGYIGYEEGGLLTESVRKNPHAVLLLDEIEKAHNDIYNLLLQVMDYATLTDNQGRKADFRNVILIMTSNAGASRLGKAQIGFGTDRINQEAVMDEVNRIFQPEFRNRLSRIVIFSFIDQNMAHQIARKKLGELGDSLAKRKVILSFTDEVVNYIKEKGISREYGAREIDRVINNEVKPLLVDRLLFGRLKKGGRCLLDYKDKTLIVEEGI